MPHEARPKEAMAPDILLLEYGISSSLKPRLLIRECRFQRSPQSMQKLGTNASLLFWMGVIATTFARMSCYVAIQPFVDLLALRGSLPRNAVLSSYEALANMFIFSLQAEKALTDLFSPNSHQRNKFRSMVIFRNNKQRLSPNWIFQVIRCGRYCSYRGSKHVFWF